MTRDLRDLVPSGWRVRTPDPLKLGRQGQLLTITKVNEAGVGFVFAGGGRGTMTYRELTMRCERMEEGEL